MPTSDENFSNLSAEEQREAIQAFRDTFGPLIGALEPALAMCVQVYIADVSGSELGKRPSEADLAMSMAAIQKNITQMGQTLEQLAMGPIETVIVSGSILKLAIDYLAANATRTVRAHGLSWNTSQGNDQTH